MPASSPSSSPAEEAQPLNVLAKGFGAGSYGSVGYAFIVENPNQNLLAENISYQVAAYDAAGAVITTDSNYITVVGPGQKLGVASSLYLSEGVSIDRIDVQVKPGQMTPADEPLPSLTAENVQYFPDEYAPEATGVIKSTASTDLEEIRVSGIAYDDAGAIIGGGFTCLNFVPANGQAAAEMSLYANGTPTKVEFYPTISGLTSLAQ